MKGAMKKKFLLLFSSVKSIIISWAIRYKTYLKKGLLYLLTLKRELTIIIMDPRFLGILCYIIIIFFLLS
jgi:hypothetical protein